MIFNAKPGPWLDKKSSMQRRGAGLILCLLLMAALLGLSLRIGATSVNSATVVRALTAFDGSAQQWVVLGMRLPRAFCALMVGAALALAGAGLQGATGNPLVSSGILGVNAGASLGVVLMLCANPDAAHWEYATAAIAGAFLATACAYLLTRFSRAELSSVNLALGGASVTAVLGSVSAAILLYRQRPMEEIRVWVLGSLAGASWHSCVLLVPFLLAGGLIVLPLGHAMNASRIGEEGATALGLHTAGVRAAATFGSLVLASGAVAVAGPIGFVGLMTPHMVRAIWGQDYRWTLPCAAMLGGIVLLASDIVARSVLAPIELPVGALTAVLGAPFFLYLAQRRGRGR